MSYLHDFKNHVIKTEKVDFIVPERIKSAMDLRMMDRKETAEKLGISERELGLILNNHKEVPKEMIFKLMEVFNLGKEYFYEVRWERV